jgi:hypothetical protein
MTAEEYKTVCEDLGISFYNDNIAATPEQLNIKAQLLQQYYRIANNMRLYRGVRPEIIIYINNIVIDICFLNNFVAICWWKDFASLPRLAGFKTAQLGNGFFKLDSVVAKIEEIARSQ